MRGIALLKLKDLYRKVKRALKAKYAQILSKDIKQILPS